MDEFWNNFLKGTLGVNATLFIVIAFHLGKLYSRMEELSRAIQEMKTDIKEDIMEIKAVTTAIQNRCIMIHLLPGDKSKGTEL